MVDDRTDEITGEMALFNRMKKERAREKARRRTAAYQQTDEYKARLLERKLLSERKRLFRKVVEAAILFGDIPSPHDLKCACCRFVATTYHHCSYTLESKGLDIMAVCDDCHTDLHKRKPKRKPFINFVSTENTR